MRILYLHQYFNTPLMNGSTRSFEFGKRLAANGHDVHIVTSARVESNEYSGRWTIEIIDGMTVYWLNCKYSNNMGFLRRIYSFLYYAFFSVIKSIRIGSDVVFATSTPLTVAIPSILISKLRRVPMVFEVRDLWPELPIAIGVLRSPALKYLARKLERVAYSCSECIIALSPGMRDGIVDTGYDQNRVAIIPNSCDQYFKSRDETSIFEFKEERKWLGDSQLVVYAGTFGEINGVGYLVDLAALVKKRNGNVKFLLVGDGKEFELVKELASKADLLNDNVYIEPSLKKNEIPTLLHVASIACSVFIDLPEMNANSANKFFDALASGTPVLINYAGWQEELVRSHSLGLAVHGLTLEESAEQLCKFLDDEKAIEIASMAVSKAADRYFDRDKLAVKFEEVILAGSVRNGNVVSGLDYDVSSDVARQV